MQLVQVQRSIWIANMIGQRGMKSGSQGPPVRHAALKTCLARVADKAQELSATVHMPRIGCGLAGGRWTQIEPLIQNTLTAPGVSVYVYNYDNEP